ncbi:unnamed protein product [Rotaria socialis]|uniref:Uncharacterized protein n=1 Tax=Rotaria socialis TaxID=392032 RepID=A0A817QEN4_9BILA|nr:unnamed protein product [Rotaria socialis]CAF3360541.1 unnamed protein product [Rotaria socialis]CAF4410410.1 unnamed protein product [Rotaria socialis]CAF4498227.1 unnamed protein product [Rotaria socialis]
MADSVVGLIKGGISLAMYLKEAYEGYKENNEECKRLIAKVDIIKDELPKLQNFEEIMETNSSAEADSTMNSKDSLKKSLNILIEDLEVFKVFHEKHRKAFKPFKFLFHKGAAKDIEKLNKNLKASCGLIMFQVSIMDKINSRQDQRDILNKIAEMPARIAKLLAERLSVTYEFRFRIRI